jgi:hypothetical protein
MNIPKNILNLYEKNASLLETMNFSRNYDNPLELCNTDAYRKSGLFTETIVNSMFSETHELPPLPDENISRNIGMILVRPDMVHVTAKFESYVSDRFELLYKSNIVMDIDTYWHMYSHDLYRRETMHSRLTRAALYIGSECCLFVFRDNADVSDVKTTDYVHETLRGSQGVYKNGTLRGDIVYHSAIELGLHKLDNNTDPLVALAVDPFGAYQTLANQQSGPLILD